MSELKELIQREIEASDSTRTARQWRGVSRWIDSGHRGTLEYCTGFGKTYTAILIIKLLRRNNKQRVVHIVVPTLQLKDQWEKELKKHKQHKNTEVFVVNSYSKSAHACNLLVLDEMHRVGAPTWVGLLEDTRYNFVLGLTATLKRLDDMHERLIEYAPVVDTVTSATARQKGWVADYREYWLGLRLNEEDMEEYQKMEKQYRRFLGVFSMDFKEAMAAMSNNEVAMRVASRNTGYYGSMANVKMAAVNVVRFMKKIKTFLADHHMKSNVARDLINAFDRKTLVFGETIEGAERTSSLLGAKAVCYHSKIRGVEREVFEDREYKSEANARRWCANHEGWSYKYKHGKHIAQRRVMKKIPSTKVKQEILHKIAHTKSLKVLCTAKALNEGYDFKGAELGVVLSRSKSQTTYIQQTGRVIRKGSKNRPVMVHLYFINTKDERVLQAAGKSAKGVVKVTTIDQILEREGILLGQQEPM